MTRTLQEPGRTDAEQHIQKGRDLLRRRAWAEAHAASEAAFTELRDLALRVGTRMAQAMSFEAEALASLPIDDAARPLLEDAVDLYQAGGAPYEAGAARLRLAESLLRLGHESSARVELEAAGSAAERIGATSLCARTTAALTGLNAAHGVRSAFGMTPRELEVLALVAHGLSNHVPDPCRPTAL